MTEQEKITTLQTFIEDDCKLIFDYIDPDKIPVIKSFLAAALRNAYTLGNTEEFIDRLFFDVVDFAAERSIKQRDIKTVYSEVE